MPNTRIMLWVAFAAILYLNYEAWMRDYREPPTVATATQPATGSPGAPGASNTLADSVPKAAPAPSATAPAPQASAAERRCRGAGRAGRGFAAGARRHIADGARRDRCPRCRHQLEGRRDRPRRPCGSIRCTRIRPTFRCGSRTATADSLYLLQSGLVGDAGEAAPTHLATWSAAQTPMCCPPAPRNCVCR